jgi:DNA-binding PadR family transcriptional regulator
MNEIINNKAIYPVQLQGDDLLLYDTLQYMLKVGIVEIQNEIYVTTQKGSEWLQNFFNKYGEYLKVFDIYCAVDLDKGEFAFEKFYDDVSVNEWHTFLDEERFNDVRLAVAEFKGLNPLEIVFLSFFNEEKFDTENWQETLSSDEKWDEIEHIANTAITMEYLMPDNVMENIVRRGSNLMGELLKEETKRKDAEVADSNNGGDEIVTETVTTEEYITYPNSYYSTYCDYYYNPYFISPCWMLPILLF